MKCVYFPVGLIDIRIQNVTVLVQMKLDTKACLVMETFAPCHDYTPANW